jgi:glycosyltransferase involved in cell wall biosynthesis
MTSFHYPTRLCLIPHLAGLGGPASFQSRLIAGLEARGVRVSYDLDDPSVTSILVVGGSSNLRGLWRAHRRGVHIVQRLNGMNWIHRKRRTGLRHYLRSEINNFILATTRRQLADEIVYQSNFSQSWWERVYGLLEKPCRIIYNGVDLHAFSPTGTGARPERIYRIQMVEGRLGSGNEPGLLNGLALVETLIREQKLPVELSIIGEASAALRAEAGKRLRQAVSWRGVLPRESIPEANRTAHLFFSADLNAACPNSVIEALACGLPVLAFDTGALKELVPTDAGRVVPYGSNHWELQDPDIPALAQAAGEILADLPPFRAGARRRAEEALGLERMIDAYLAVFR